jgi:DNA polymerase (family 10)
MNAADLRAFLSVSGLLPRYLVQAEEYFLANGPGRSAQFYRGESGLIELPGPVEEVLETQSSVDRDNGRDQEEPPSLAEWILSLWRSATSVDARILGDFHVHTVHSDGIDTVESMVSTAHRMGYRWIGLADHAPGIDQPYRLTVDRFLKRVEASKTAALGYPVRLLQAVEADLGDSGVQDIPTAIVDQLDYVMISSHNPELERSDRVLRALENAFSWSLVKGYAHPFWMLNFEDYKTFIAEAVSLAIARNVAVELNFYPDSIRANHFLIDEARRLGGSIMLSTDAHHANALPLMRFAGAFLKGRESVEILNFSEAPF